MRIKIIFLGLFGHFCLSTINCFGLSRSVDFDSTIWSKKWYPNNNARLKGAVVLDSLGTLMVVGQNFTTTDSIDHPTTIAVISADGKMLQEKHIGRTGVYKKNYRELKHYNWDSYEERLVQIFKTNDNKILLVGYKTFKNRQRRLWLVEVDDKLNFLVDTVYMDLVVSDIGKYFPLNTTDGWMLITDHYWEVNGLSKYGVSVYYFNDSLACIDIIRSVTCNVGKNMFRLNAISDVVDFGDDVFIAGMGGFTSDSLDEDKVIVLRRGCILSFNKTTKKVRLIKIENKGMYPFSLLNQNNQICVVYSQEKKNKQGIYLGTHVLVCYNAKFVEMWRDTQAIGRIGWTGKLFFVNGEWLSYGTSYLKAKGSSFYLLRYNAKGKLLEKRLSTTNYDPAFIQIVAINKTTFYHLLVDDSWRIDKINYSE